MSCLKKVLIQREHRRWSIRLPKCNSLNLSDCRRQLRRSFKLYFGSSITFNWDTEVAFVTKLQKDPSQRTDNDISQLLRLLSKQVTFASLPFEERIALCREAFYRDYEEGSILCRHGQRANVYYMILDGEVSSLKSRIQMTLSSGASWQSILKST